MSILGSSPLKWHPTALRYIARNFPFIAGWLIAAFAIGLAYRHFVDPLEERIPGYYLRSGFHAAGLVAAALSVHLLRGWQARPKPYGIAG